MEPTESFSLRWDDFEANTRVALKELREERDFCDVTLATEGKQVSAHKVILAGGSKFFQQVLKQNPHPHPLIYLKGVRYEYLLSMLDFLYTGEANINEKELKSFLDVANDLQIKGLIEKNPSRKTSANEGGTIPGNVSHQDQSFDVKKEAGSLLHDETPSQGDNRGSLSTCEEGTIDAPLASNMKVELDDTIHSTASFGMEANHAGLNDTEDMIMMDFKIEIPNPNEIGSIFEKGQMTDDLCEQSEDLSDDAFGPNSGKLASVFLEDGNVKTKPGDTSSFHFNVEEDRYVEGDDYLRGFDDKDQMFSECDMTEREPVDSDSKCEDERNSHCWYEEGEKCKDVGVSHDGEPGENHNELSIVKKGRKVCSVRGKSVRDNFALKEHMRTHPSEKPFPCLFCPKSFDKSSNLKLHTMIHTGEKPFPCLLCPKTFRESSKLKEHTRIHTGEKPFQCLVCFKRFTFSSALNFHKKRKDCYMNLGE